MLKNQKNRTITIKVVKQIQPKGIINQYKQKRLRLSINKFRCKQIKWWYSESNKKTREKSQKN